MQPSPGHNRASNLDFGVRRVQIAQQGSPPLPTERDPGCLHDAAVQMIDTSTGNHWARRNAAPAETIEMPSDGRRPLDRRGDRLRALADGRAPGPGRQADRAMCRQHLFVQRQILRDVLAPPRRRRVAAGLKDRSAPPGADGAFRSALENEPGNRHGRKDQSNRDVGIDGKSHDHLRLLEALPAGAARRLLVWLLTAREPDSSRT